jgi:Bifunctional DNA primase/polymerase, N-terminal
MADRLPIVLQWLHQGCRPIPCQAGTKHARVSWTRFQARPPTHVELHRWWTGTRRSNANVALVLGPPPGGNVLALNINIKHGHDGHATLQRLGWTLPPTPTIRTPSGGLCPFFQVPDRQRYPFPFHTHVHPDGYPGLEFRGAGGYQLVPTSRTPDGAYRWRPPWTLDRFRDDLAALPEPILQAWIALDRGAKFSRVMRTASPDKALKAGSTADRPPSPTDASPPRPQTPSQSQAPRAAPTPPSLPTITTRLSAEGERVFVNGFDVREQACAEALCRRLDLPVDWLAGGWPFPCRLPGHGPDHHPSATWYKTPSGFYIYKDWHRRGPHGLYTLPEVFAAITSRVVKRLPGPSRMAWRLRLMVEEGWLVPEPVRMRAMADEASPLLQRYCAGFALLIACKSCHPETRPHAATVFAKGFAARWCGIPEGSIWGVHQEALQRDLLVFAGVYKNQILYRPGKDGEP